MFAQTAPMKMPMANNATAGYNITMLMLRRRSKYAWFAGWVNRTTTALMPFNITKNNKA